MIPDHGLREDSRIHPIAMKLAGKAPEISFKGVSKAYPGARPGLACTVALDALTLDIPKSSIFSIVGPTGCGKSTALNLIAGFEKPSTGSVEVEGETVDEPDIDRSIVFQQPYLFPWMTVRQNIVLGVKDHGVAPEECEPRADRLLKAVGLEAFQSHYPYQLSGGMQQRAQIARALISEPKVLLMDEPFGALDAQTRLLMQRLLLDLWQEFRPTIFFITHDVAEAIFISDEVLVMSQRPGRIKLQLAISTPKPRGLDFLSSSDFMSLQKTILDSVQEEVGLSRA